MQLFICQTCGRQIILSGSEAGALTDICPGCFEKAGEKIDKMYESNPPGARETNAQSAKGGSDNES